MTDKLTFATLDSLEAETSAINTINGNFAALQAFLDTLLSRDGTAPNQMLTVLDMNEFEIINLPTPVNPTDVVRLEDANLFLRGPQGPQGVAGPAGINGTGTGDMLRANNLSDVLSAATSRTNLGLAIGTNVEAWSATLDLLAALSTTSFGRTLLTLTNVAALITLVAGTPSGSSLFWNIPVTTKNANYTLALTDRGTALRSTSASTFTWTIPPSIWTIGDTVDIRAGVASGNITIARGAGVTLTQAGTTTNKDLTMVAGGLATLFMEDTDTWVSSGVGVS